MKYIILVIDGAADYPVKEYGYKTPLEYANLENIREIEKFSEVGLVKTLFEGMDYGSDVANLTILGYDPRKYLTGRGALEAAALNIEFKEGDIAFRCNFITVINNKLISYNAGGITTEESRILIEELNKEFSNIGKFYTGIGYRNIFITNLPVYDVKTYPPHDIVNKNIFDYLIKPRNNKYVEVLNEMILRSREILENHWINEKRKREGKLPANMIWLWGQGTKPKLPSFFEKYKLRGGVAAEVIIIKGIGKLLDMEVPDIPNTTGSFDTSYENIAKYSIKLLDRNDFVFIHVESPDEAGHKGDFELKVKCLEEIDRKIIGYILDNVEEEFKLAILPDHATPVSVRTHTSDPVPYLIYSSMNKRLNDIKFCEKDAKRGKFIEGLDFMKHFLRI